MQHRSTGRVLSFIAGCFAVAACAATEEPADVGELTEEDSGGRGGAVDARSGGRADGQQPRSGGAGGDADGTGGGAAPQTAAGGAPGGRAGSGGGGAGASAGMGATAGAGGSVSQGGSGATGGNTGTPGVGTGGAAKAKYIMSVTGAGAGPSLAGAVVANCEASAATDAKPCLQAAMDQAAAAGKALLIPKVSSAYRLTTSLMVKTSVVGTGGMPLLQMVGATGSAGKTMLVIRNQPGPILLKNLRLDGGYVAESSSGEHDHNVSISSSKDITIEGNIFENAKGDNIYLGAGSSAASSNILIAGNTLKNPRRCGVAFIAANGSVVINNIFDKQVNYVSAVDFEPNQTPDATWNIEVAYNQFIMTNRTRGQYGSDGKAASAWQNDKTPEPGGNLWLHDNYGTFGTGWWMRSSSHKGGDGDWVNVNATTGMNNVEGPCTGSSCPR